MSDSLLTDSRLSKQIFLGKGDLARAYESTTAAAYFYSFDHIPGDDRLHEDLLVMAALLKRIYAGESSQARTEETSLDVIAAVTALEEATTGRPAKGQGFGLSQPELRAVERRAMQAAVDHFSQQGFEVEDTSLEASYDLKISRNGLVKYIEVKGSTGPLGDIVLTKNEVAHHIKHHPNNALFVLYEISLTKSPTAPFAKDGKVHVEDPWLVDLDRLSPLAYRYRLC